MNWHDPKSPIWPTIRYAITAGMLCVMLTCNYNGWDSRDWNTVLGVLGSLGVFDGIKQVATKSGGE